jgi:uncharacterized protein (TIGR03435 family)
MQGAKSILRTATVASLLTLCAAFGQPSGDRPAFEVASIKAYPPGAPFPKDGSIGIKVSPDGVAWRYARLLNCIDRYDITAKASGPVSKDQLKLMVQTLLEDRFKLKVHREMQELPVAVLTVAKNGPKNLRPLPPAGSFNYAPSDGKLIFEGSMSNFAAILGNSPPYGIREQVVDQTGIAGWFDLTLDVKDLDVNDPAFGGKYDEMQSAAFAFLSAALEKKYGLRLEHRKVSMESIVVDSGNKTPTEN